MKRESLFFGILYAIVFLPIIAMLVLTGTAMADTELINYRPMVEIGYWGDPQDITIDPTSKHPDYRTIVLLNLNKWCPEPITCRIVPNYVISDIEVDDSVPNPDDWNFDNWDFVSTDDFQLTPGAEYILQFFFTPPEDTPAGTYEFVYDIEFVTEPAWSTQLAFKITIPEPTIKPTEEPSKEPSEEPTEEPSEKVIPEPSEEEKLASWYIFRDNVHTRIAELLATDELLKDGLGPENIDHFNYLYKEIAKEEAIESWLRIYPGLTKEDILTADRIDYIQHKYTCSTNAPDQAYYQSLWDATVARLRNLAESGEMTALYYEIMPYSHFRFANGETFRDYLSRTGKIGEKILENDAMLAFIDLLANCTVKDDGHLVYHAPDGTEQTVLAWYDTVLKNYDEDAPEAVDFENLP